MVPRVSFVGVSLLLLLATPSTALAGDEPHFAVGAGGHMAFGTAPAVALGTRVSAEMIARLWSVAVEGRYDLSLNSVESSQGLAPRTTLAGGSLVPCLRARAAWACGVALASRVTSQGEDAGNASLFVGFGARFEMHFALPQDFALRLTGEVLAHPFAYELHVNNQLVFRSSTLSTTFGPALVHAF